MKRKQQNKICGLSKNNMVFYYKVPTTSPTLQNYVSIILSPFPQIFPLWAVLNYIIMIQNQQEFKIQNYNVP
jgi:hypothetical protein